MYIALPYGTGNLTAGSGVAGYPVPAMLQTQLGDAWKALVW